MIVDYESTQTVEIVVANGYREAEVVIGLEQTHAGTAPNFSPLHGGDPGSDPEWEVTTLSLIDEGGKSREFGSLTVMLDIVSTIFGGEVWEAMIEAAILDANENYDRV